MKCCSQTPQNIIVNEKITSFNPKIKNHFLNTGLVNDVLIIGELILIKYKENFNINDRVSLETRRFNSMLENVGKNNKMTFLPIKHSDVVQLKLDKKTMYEYAIFKSPKEIIVDPTTVFSNNHNVVALLALKSSVIENTFNKNENKYINRFINNDILGISLVIVTIILLIIYSI